MRLIDADKLIDYFYKFFKGYEGVWEKDQPQYWADNMAECVHEQPTVDAEPIRHGHWNWIRDSRRHCKACSVCGRIDKQDFYAFKYCPHCGAKMDEH